MNGFLKTEARPDRVRLADVACRARIRIFGTDMRPIVTESGWKIVVTVTIGRPQEPQIGFVYI
jgi:hypothetical protein